MKARISTVASLLRDRHPEAHAWLLQRGSTSSSTSQPHHQPKGDEGRRRPRRTERWEQTVERFLSSSSSNGDPRLAASAIASHVAWRRANRVDVDVDDDDDVHPPHARRVTSSSTSTRGRSIADAKSLEDLLSPNPASSHTTSSVHKAKLLRLAELLPIHQAGVDVQGRSIFWVRAANFDAKEWVSLNSTSTASTKTKPPLTTREKEQDILGGLRVLVWLLEKLIPSLASEREHPPYAVVVVDLSNFTLSQADSEFYALVRKLIELVEQYPSVLSKLLLIRAPLFFNVVWSGVKKLLGLKRHGGVLSDVVTVGASQSALKEAFRGVVDPAQLPRDFPGGLAEALPLEFPSWVQTYEAWASSISSSVAAPSSSSMGGRVMSGGLVSSGEGFDGGSGVSLDDLKERSGERSEERGGERSEESEDAAGRLSFSASGFAQLPRERGEVVAATSPRTTLTLPQTTTKATTHATPSRTILGVDAAYLDALLRKDASIEDLSSELERAEEEIRLRTNQFERDALIVRASLRARLHRARMHNHAQHQRLPQLPQQLPQQHQQDHQPFPRAKLPRTKQELEEALARALDARESLRKTVAFARNYMEIERDSEAERLAVY